MHKTFYVAASVITVALSAKLAAASAPVVFFNNNTNMCLQPASGSTAAGMAIVQEPCNNSGANVNAGQNVSSNVNANVNRGIIANPAQEWTSIPVGDGNFQYKNVLSGLCLDARGKAQYGTPVQQWKCGKITNQIWKPTPYPIDSNAPTGPGIQVISQISGSDNYCLTIPAGEVKAGLPMKIENCNRKYYQNWQIWPVGSCVNNDPGNAACDQTGPLRNSNG
jgi:Ricin-type beta-trefoil lectin domain-like